MPLLWFELSALIICLLRFRDLNKSRALKWFLLLLILTNIVEWGSYYYLFTIKIDKKKTSNWIYNVFNPLESGFYFYYYYGLINSVKIKRLIPRLYISLLILVCINICFFQKWLYLDTYTFILGYICLVFFSVSYFKQLAQNVDEKNILALPHFWISVGVLLFYSGEIPLFIFFEYFLHIKTGFAAFTPVWKFFTNFLNIILYTCLSIAFLCRPTLQKISS